MKDLVVVKFTTRDAPYNAGETAGFSRETAARLVAKGVAEYSDQADAPAAPTPAPPVIEVTRTADPPFVETEEGEDGAVTVKDARSERDKMVRAPTRRK